MSEPRNAPALVDGQGAAVLRDCSVTPKQAMEIAEKWDLTPLGQRLHVVKLTKEETKGGIILPSTAADRTYDGMVISAGPLAFVDHPYRTTEGCRSVENLQACVERFSYHLQKGDLVRFASWSGATEHNNITSETVLIMNAEDLTAVTKE